MSRRATGSSPLTRGKRPPCPQELRRTGLIPTHAGKTVGEGHVRDGLGAHPHSRGENSVAALSSEKLAGSSPLTRGKLLPLVGGGLALGLIPTHAGKTPRRPRPRVRSWAHPHSRGENQAALTALRNVSGSSPLTRGKPSSRSRAKPVRGLIPTHAGKTRRGSRAGSRPGAHPHSRGENSCESLIVSWVGGSSPLTRGKLLVAVVREALRGLIPTHAGKTAPSTSSP